jgi:malonyl-CoA O-methyltransferase
MSEENEEYRLEKPYVARSFSKAANDYQGANQLQLTIASRLLERLELISMKPSIVLDLGSGPGASSAQLAKRYKKAAIVETDISLSMLQLASKQAPRFFSKRSRLCADAEIMSVKTGAIDLVFSNLMLQWCDNLDRVFKEVCRVLKPNGLFIFSTFGPDTLMELRKSWQKVDEDTHVNAFIDMHDVGDALIRAGMENPVMETERIIVEYEDARRLMRDLKKLGAHNVNSGRRKTLTGKRRLLEMLAHYEQWRIGGRLPASYEVIYGHAWSATTTRATRLDEKTLAYPVSAVKLAQPP